MSQSNSDALWGSSTDFSRPFDEFRLWNNLPDELKLRVLEHALRYDEPISEDTHSKLYVTSVLRANKWIYIEGKKIYYSNHFQVSRRVRRCPGERLFDRDPYPPYVLPQQHLRHSMTALTVLVPGNGFDPPWASLFKAPFIFRLQLQDQDMTRTISCLSETNSLPERRLQGFASLERLTIIMEEESLWPLMNLPRPCDGRIFHSTVDRIENTMRNVESAIYAKEVKVVIQESPHKRHAGSLDGDHPNGKCGCMTRIEKAIQNMVMASYRERSVKGAQAKAGA